MDKPKTYNEWHSSLEGFEGLRHANCCRISYEAGQQSRQTEVDQLREELAKLKDRLELAHHLATQSTWSSLKQLRKVIKALRGEHE